MKHAPRLAMVTAGAANMICGSCLNDNALARALHRAGIDVQLIPTYTPIRTDHESSSIERIFFGGINVYLDQHVPLYRWLPTWTVNWLDRPRILRWASQRGIQTEASQLGPLCVSMMRGHRGRQRREAVKLLRYFQTEFQPDLINFSNILIAGCAEILKQQLQIPLFVTLQGDDLFLESLDEKHRRLAIAEVARIDRSIDRYLCHSNFYADRMASLLNLNRDKIGVVPLGIDVDQAGFAGPSPPASRPMRPPTVGYLARLAPEKGLHLACEAVRMLRERPATAETRLLVAGWLGSAHREYADNAMKQLSTLGRHVVDFRGEVTLQQKQQFLTDVDVLCVPSPYQEPKGLYVLEAMAAGVPVVSPDHGAFPELISDSGGGRLFRPGDLPHLVEVLTEVLIDPLLRAQLSHGARETVVKTRSSERVAESVWHEFQRFLT